MTNLQVLRKRHKSIQATADMAAAMKTAATVKYAKISKALSNIDAYSKACDDALALFGSAGLPRKTTEIQNRNCLVLLSNNRGFCGGFNSELIRFFEMQMGKEPAPPLLYVFGQKAEVFCKSKGYEFISLPLSDIPSYEDAEALTGKLYEIYASGEANEIRLVYQRFVNMMNQVPADERILPHKDETAADEKDLLFLPDRDTARQGPAMFCLINTVYRIILSHTAGIRAATTIAMRSACDNAEKSLEKLETLINRIRQAEVTNSVIETSSYLTEVNQQ